MSVPTVTEQGSAENTARNIVGLRPPWQPGQSGNPGGRPKGLARRIREEVGNDGSRLVKVVIGVLDDESASRRDRLEAASWLADRAFGKPAQVIAGEEGAPLQIVIRSMLATAAADLEAEPVAGELEEGSGA